MTLSFNEPMKRDESAETAGQIETPVLKSTFRRASLNSVDAQLARVRIPERHLGFVVSLDQDRGR